MLVKYSVRGPDGQQTSGTSAVTATFLHVKGKLIFFHCHSQENDLLWARTVSKAWASAIVDANPSDAAIAARESIGSGRSYDWKAVPPFVIVVGVIAVAWSIARLAKRFQRSRT